MFENVRLKTYDNMLLCQVLTKSYFAAPETAVNKVIKKRHAEGEEDGQAV